ncbi:MAG: VPLPA-CTERM sorting domain-containing protein [Betaproteobacteria bacterium]|nr:MAG: VPLPA-CTERM sorting domain-containing protein [Betaproteobacteria bacterium]
MSQRASAPGFESTCRSPGSRRRSVNGPVSAVPIPAAAWLFGSGLVGFIAIARRRTKGSDRVLASRPMRAV